MVNLNEVLLPSGARPLQYHITLDIDLEKSIVNGSAQIEIDLEFQTSTIVLHALDLEVDANSVQWRTLEDSKIPLNSSPHLDKRLQTASFQFAKPLSPGTGYLDIKWSFTLGDSLAGLYRSKYMSLDGNDKYMAVTQFEATDARRCFPCFDEPAKKARFKVCLLVPANLNAISNMPVESCNHLNWEKVKYTFENSPIMSTYLVAFIVGEFDYLSTLTENNIRTTVYTPKGKSYLGRHALKVASEALTFFEEEFQIKYPLPKSDLLAIPDFAAGAMENWGAVTYRETRLLVDKDTTPFSSLQACTRTVCHELAHMWFGNLVTMQWWTDLWLNEGFARFMEFKAADHIFPEWKIWQTFCYAVHGAALELDSLSNSHPVQVPVVHPDEISEIFDRVSYAKGASIIRMLSQYLGEDLFMQGIQNYLKKNAYANARTETLWKFLGQTSKRPVEKIMDFWTSKVGYPAIEIEEKPNEDPRKRSFILTQRRFGMKTEDDTIWQIPIMISTLKGQTLTILMTSKETTVDIQAEEEEYVRFNYGQVGFFRCCYPTYSKSFQQLADAANAQILPPPDRLGLLSDAFACADVGLSPTKLALDLAVRFSSENESSVVKELYYNLKRVLNLYSDTEDIHLKLQSFVVSIFNPLLQRLGWEKRLKEPLDDTLCGITAISALYEAGDKEVMEKLSILFQNRLKEDIAADLRQIAYKAAVKIGGIKIYEELLNIYNTSSMAEERRRAMVALSHSDDPELQKRTLKWVVSSGQVRIQDLSYPVSGVAGAKSGATLVWQWFKDEAFAQFQDLSTSQQTIFSGLVSSCINNLSSEEHVFDVKEFFLQNPVPCADRSIKQALERIEKQVRRKQNELSQLREYFGDSSEK